MTGNNLQIDFQDSNIYNVNQDIFFLKAGTVQKKKHIQETACENEFMGA